MFNQKLTDVLYEDMNAPNGNNALEALAKLKVDIKTFVDFANANGSKFSSLVDDLYMASGKASVLEDHLKRMKTGL